MGAGKNMYITLTGTGSLELEPDYDGTDEVYAVKYLPYTDADYLGLELAVAFYSTPVDFIATIYSVKSGIIKWGDIYVDTYSDKLAIHDINGYEAIKTGINVEGTAKQWYLIKLILNMKENKYHTVQWNDEVIDVSNYIMPSTTGLSNTDGISIELMAGDYGVGTEEVFVDYVILTVEEG